MRYNIAQDGEVVEIHVQDAASAPHRCSRHSRRDAAAARPTSTTGSRALEWEAATASSQSTSHHALGSTSTLMRCVPAWTTPWNPPPTLSCRRARIVAELAPLMPPTQTDRDARWLRAARQAKALAWFSLAWMTGEGVLGLIAGIAANLISLIGWVLGSVIEGLASIMVICRFTGSRTASETSGRRAQRAVAQGLESGVGRRPSPRPAARAPGARHKAPPLRQAGLVST